MLYKKLTVNKLKIVAYIIFMVKRKIFQISKLGNIYQLKFG